MATYCPFSCADELYLVVGISGSPESIPLTCLSHPALSSAKAFFRFDLTVVLVHRVIYPSVSLCALMIFLYSSFVGCFESLWVG